MGDQIRQQNIFVRPVRALRDRTLLDDMNAVTGWTAFGTDTANLTVSDKSMLGSKSLSFDKADTAENSLIAGVQKVLDSPLDLSEYLSGDEIHTAVFLSSTAAVASVSFRLGTDASNYSVWTVDDSVLTANVWNEILLAFNQVDVANQVGTGHDLSNIQYIAVLVTFDLETSTLTGILSDHMHVQMANL